jgi:hypothetical protein
MQAIERALLGVLANELPDAVVRVDPWHGGAITVDKGTKRLFGILAHTAYVNLWLWDGATLPDPTGIAKGNGTQMRHVSVRTVAEARSGPVRELIRAQMGVLV